MTGKNGNNKNFEKIILVDNLTSLKEIENFASGKFVKIITFDYASHKKLNEKNIEHEISEIYSNREDVEKTQKKCYEFLKWCDLDIINQNVSFSGINIPKLFTDQLIPSIASGLKKFLELKLITDKFPNSTYFASGELMHIIKTFQRSFTEIPSGKNEEFYFDKIELETKVGKKNITFTISDAWYKKIKNQGEGLLQIIFGNKNNKSDKKSTLIVELNTEIFNDFFLESKKMEKNILYYGRRRPAIWNIESFKIIKNSGCNLITSNKLENKELMESKTIVTKIQEKFLDILDNNQELKDFFSIDEIPLYTVIIPKIKNLVGTRIKKTIFEIIVAKKIFEEYLIDSVIVISGVGMTEQIIIQIAQQQNIPIFHLQEGLHYDTPEAFENSNSQGMFPELADKYIAWGKFSRDNLINFGKIDPDRVVELGSPRFCKLSFKEEENTEDFVLLATMPPQLEEIKGLDVRNLEKYMESILKICEIVSNQNKKLKIKLHPTFDVLDISKNLEKKFPNVQVISKGDINPLIRACSSLIVTGFSTVIIQGQILQKPVISIPLIDYSWGEPSVFKENSCLLINLEQLDETLEKISADTVYKNKLISNSNNFLTKCFKYRKESSQLIWDYIKNNFH